MKTTIKNLAAGTFIAILILAGNVKTEATELKASSLEIVETSLQMKNWMTDEAFWNTNFDFTLEIAPESESNLKVESWMTNNSTWISSYTIATVSETDMELESWMTNENVWEVEETSNETALPLENWMVNSEIWK